MTRCPKGNAMEENNNKGVMEALWAVLIWACIPVLPLILELWGV
jgi:hypothetical protein